MSDYPRPPRVGLGMATTTGSKGERLITRGPQLPRPSGTALRRLLSAMSNLGFPDIPPTGFDAVEIPEEAYAEGFTFDSPKLVTKWCEHLVFLEIKTCTQERVDEGFGRFLFAFPETELRAAEILGSRHVVILLNQRTGQMKRTSVPELLARASSKTWQLTVQLSPTEEVWEGPTLLDLFGEPSGPPSVLDLFGRGGTS